MKFSVKSLLLLTGPPGIFRESSEVRPGEPAAEANTTTVTVSCRPAGSVGGFPTDY